MSGHPDSLWVRLARKEWAELEIGYVFNLEPKAPGFRAWRAQESAGLGSAAPASDIAGPGE